MKEKDRLSIKDKGKHLIQHVQRSNIFPDGSMFNTEQSDLSSSIEADYVCIVDWKLNTDETRPNKRSRSIKIVIDIDALSDCQNLDKAKSNLVKILKRKYESFNPDHHEEVSTSVMWSVGTSELNE